MAGVPESRIFVPTNNHIFKSTMFDISILIATLAVILLPPLLERNRPVEKLEERFQELASPVLF